MMQVQTTAATRLNAAQTLTGMSLEPGCEQNLNGLVAGTIAQLEGPTMTSEQTAEEGGADRVSIAAVLVGRIAHVNSPLGLVERKL
jgi:hypothetical protein